MLVLKYFFSFITLILNKPIQLLFCQICCSFVFPPTLHCGSKTYTLHWNSCLARLDEKCSTFIIRGKRAWAPAQTGFWGNWFIRGGKQMQGFYCWKVPGVISMVNRSNYTWWYFHRPTEKHRVGFGEEKGTGSSIKNRVKTWEMT